MGKPEIKASETVPEVFVNWLKEDENPPEGVHRVIYLDIVTGKRTVNYIEVGDCDSHTVVRSYVFFPYMRAVNHMTTEICDDPYYAIRGRGIWKQDPVHNS